MSALLILAPILAEIGAPLLKGMVERRFGQTAGDVTNAVVETIAGKLGVDATPEAISEKYTSDPEATRAAVLDTEKEWAEVARGAMELHGQYLSGIDADAAKGGMNALWRPVNGLLFAVGLFAVLLTACFAILARIPIDASQLPLVTLVGTVVGPWAGVIGYYVGQRTKEKIN